MTLTRSKVRARTEYRHTDMTENITYPHLQVVKDGHHEQRRRFHCCWLPLPLQSFLDPPLDGYQVTEHTLACCRLGQPSS